MSYATNETTVEELSRLVIGLTAILADHLQEHQTLGRLDEDTLESDLDRLHEIRATLDPRLLPERPKPTGGAP